jgi:hypothetical protein
MINADEQMILLHARLAEPLAETPRVREALQRNASLASLGAVFVQLAGSGQTERCEAWAEFLASLPACDVIAAVGRHDPGDEFTLGPMSRLAFVAGWSHARRAGLSEPSSEAATLSVDCLPVQLGPHLRVITAILDRISALKGAPEPLTLDDLNLWLANVDLPQPSGASHPLSVASNLLFDSRTLFAALEGAFAAGEWNEEGLQAVAEATVKETE